MYEVKNLLERTEYLITLHMLTAHSDPEKVRDLYESIKSVSPRDVLTEDVWTPCVATTGITAGIDAPSKLHVTDRETNQIIVEWKPAKAFGMYVLLHNILRWKEKRDEEPDCLSTREKPQSLRSKTSGSVRCGSKESAAVLRGLYPGANFEVQVEACFGYDSNLWKGAARETSDESSFSSSDKQEISICEIAVSNLVSSWTRAPPGKPRLLLRSISQTDFELSWDRPVLLELGEH